MFWYRFANFFSNVYLDPGLLFWGMFSLYWLSLPQKSVRNLALSGVALSFSFLTKGLIAIGFLPACAYLLWTQQNKKQIGVWVLGLTLPLFSYVALLKMSTCPEFLSIYFSRQFENRMKVQWSLLRILSWQNGLSFFTDLAKDTLYLFPLAFLGRSRIAWLGLVPFAGLYLGIGLWGGQYWITVLPWIAWLIADFLSDKIEFSIPKVIAGSTTVFVGAVFILQYIPIRSHGVVPPEETPALRLLNKNPIRTVLKFDSAPEIPHFGIAATYAWYGGIEVEYVEGEIPKAIPGQLYLKLHADTLVDAEMIKKGWLLYQGYSHSALWTAPTSP